MPLAPYWQAVQLENKCDELRKHIADLDQVFEGMVILQWINQHTLKAWSLRTLADAEKALADFKNFHGIKQ